MDVEEKEAAATSEYKGKTYHHQVGIGDVVSE
jgi:hypothetical protein